MKAGYPPIVIKVDDRLAYYNALDKAHMPENYSNFIDLVAAEVDNSLDLYLSTVN